jgi:hypothetical protein
MSSKCHQVPVVVSWNNFYQSDFDSSGQTVWFKWRYSEISICCSRVYLLPRSVLNSLWSNITCHFHCSIKSVVFRYPSFFFRSPDKEFVHLTWALLNSQFQYELRKALLKIWIYIGLEIYLLSPEWVVKKCHPHCVTLRWYIIMKCHAHNVMLKYNTSVIEVCSLTLYMNVACGVRVPHLSLSIKFRDWFVIPA